jgi:hypothetical protein
MVSQSIWIAIVIGMFFVGIGVSYTHFANTYDPMSMKFQNQELFDQMMSNNPKMFQQWMDSGMMNSQQMMMDSQYMNPWMNTMMQNPQAMQQMHDMMGSNSQYMNQMMDTMMNDPQIQQQMMAMMMQNQGMMDTMMNNKQMMNMMSGSMMGNNMMMMDSGMMERGNMAMGFDQTKIMHFFEETSTGGEIGIIALDKNDAKTISEIRSHVEDIQYAFSQGNFSKPFFIHAQVVPGTQIMNEKKDLIQYSTRQIEGGEILVLTTNDPKVLDAIKQFLDFQSSQHMGH